MNHQNDERKKMKFPNTAKALIEYDAKAPEIQKLWDDADSGQTINAAEEADMAALRKVQDAFYKDTKFMNSLEDCRRLNLHYLQRFQKP